MESDLFESDSDHPYMWFYILFRLDSLKRNLGLNSYATCIWIQSNFVITVALEESDTFKIKL